MGVTGVLAVFVFGGVLAVCVCEVCYQYVYGRCASSV